MNTAPPDATNPSSTVTGAARIAGVVGNPIAHSLSPWLHNRWIAALGLDAAYVPFAPLPHRFAAFVDGLRGTIVGLNVTSPFKREALVLADRASAPARRAGSANLLLFARDGSIEAHSTDGAGLLTALARRAPGVSPARGPAAILGAGGAGAAAAVALADAGWTVRLLNRTRAPAAALAEMLPRTTAHPLEEAAMLGCALVVNALGPDAPRPGTPSGAALLDMDYRGHHTLFLAPAALRGDPCVHGLDMLLAQAEPSFEALFGLAPPPLELRADAVAILSGRARSLSHAASSATGAGC